MVSVIIPCYNQAAFLEEALASVYKQTYTAWECIIVNDGSTDETAAIATTWTAKDPRFTYMEQENQGVVGARNAGIQKATGKVILPLDADDTISNEYMRLAVAHFSAHPDTTVVYCDASFFGSKEGKWELPEFTLETLALRNIIFNCAFFKKEDWAKIGGYDGNLQHGLEDWEFWIHLLKSGGAVYKIPAVCFHYRQLDHSRNQSIAQQHYKEIYEYISVKHADLYVQQFGSFKEVYQRLQKCEKQHTKLQKALAKEQKKLNLRAILRNLKRKIGQ